MNDNHNPDVQSADGADVDQITVMFDTSVLLYVIMDEVGLSHDIKFTPHVRKFVKGKNQAVSKEVASQIEIRLKEKKSKGRARNESIGGSGVGSMIERAVKTLREKYEIIDTDEWKSYSEKIENILSTLVSNPEHAMSQNWLTRKKTLLFKKNKDINGLETIEAKRDALRILKKEMLKGKDITILAKAMKMSETRKIHFVSNDGDHVFLGKSVMALTKNRMRVYKPRNWEIYHVT